MSLVLNQTLTAIAVNLTSSFLASGGTTPYAYSVRQGGAGGSIDSDGIYTAPSVVSEDPSALYDTIQVRDHVGAIKTARILIGTPLLLFCDILQKEMGLADGSVYLWDQKIMQPTDFGLYIAVQVLSAKPFSNINTFDGSTNSSVQSINMYTTLQLDVISRGPAARDRKEEVVMALNSNYAQSQQEANSFYIGKLPPGAQFLNLSAVDGAAIPYRFNISIAMQYFVTKTKTVPYFDSFEAPVLTIAP